MLLKLIRKGKVKEVYEAGADILEFVFTDHISVFDKIIPNTVPHKGDTLCRTSAIWFQIVKDMGIRTHFRELVSSNRMRVKRVEVINDYSKIDNSTRNYLIPLEFVMRHYVAGSLMDRLLSGNITPADIGFRAGHKPKYGEKLNEPFFEVTTKLEPIDRHLTFKEALGISGLSENEMNTIRSTIERIDDRIQEEVSGRGLIHVDGKKEFAFDKDRHLMLVDTFGTSDEDRWWDADAYSQGRIEELSKEFVRQYYRNTGYHEMLEMARKRRSPEPPIPALPEEMVKKTSDLYVAMFERITGESFS